MKRFKRYTYKEALKELMQQKKSPWEGYSKKQRIRVLDTQDIEFVQENIQQMP